ncbi:MAG: M55 family metallopeptidase [Chloroflexota bacterium]|nr:M55 family metallopeptidase [Chloroflexota bacterium]
MRVYLSLDMEGIGGIGHAAPTERSDRGFLAGIRLVALLDLPPG